MFTEFFYLLRRMGIPVSLTEWMTLMEALHKGLAGNSLSGFYYLARSILIKTETQYDKYDQAFLKYFGNIETPPGFAEEVLRWLENSLPPLRISPGEKRPFQQWDLEELKRALAERLSQQKEEHHGGSRWVGTGGTSPFGHSGYHPAGLRIGGESVNLSAVKVAAERRYKDFRTDKALQIRHFELAIRRLRRLSTRVEGPRDNLDLEETVEATGRNAGRLELIWARSRRNAVKLLVLMDSGGSMNHHAQLCSRLFEAFNRAEHLKDLQFFYFHNCIYEQLFLDPFCRHSHSILTAEVIRQYGPDYKLIIVGDASMATSELLMPYGALDWGVDNEEPGIAWLKRLAGHYTHKLWLNPIPAAHWGIVEGARTISLISQLYPMVELTLDGLQHGIKKLMVAR